MAVVIGQVRGLHDPLILGDGRADDRADLRNRVGHQSPA
jgi:hypothetical protein